MVLLTLRKHPNQEFIQIDTTDLLSYSDNYVCFDFCHDILENAFDQGYKAGLVYLKFEDAAHTIICFDTTDEGLLFVEPQTDDIVTVQVGSAYEIAEEPNVVQSFSIVW